MDWYSKSARLLHLGHTATLQELVYEGRRELFANLKDLQNVIRDKWHNVDDQTMRQTIFLWKRRMEDLICTFSVNQLTDDYCDILLWPDAYEQWHEWWTACKHCFMTCNTTSISFVSRLIQKCFRQKYLDLVCSLKSEYVLFTSFTLIALLHNAVRMSGTFFAPPGIYLINLHLQKTEVILTTPVTQWWQNCRQFHYET